MIVITKADARILMDGVEKGIFEEHDGAGWREDPVHGGHGFECSTSDGEGIVHAHWHPEGDGCDFGGWDADGNTMEIMRTVMGFELKRGRLIVHYYAYVQPARGMPPVRKDMQAVIKVV